jgi:DNA invertase Pin-like site-specific DNA recombinase
MQLESLRRVAIQRGWEVISELTDVCHGDIKQPNLCLAVGMMKAGQADVFAVWKIDRVGRSLIHLLHFMEDVKTCGVSFVSVTDAGLDMTTPSGQLLFHILGAFAEFEKGLIRERVKEGVAAARAAGVHCGRPKVELDQTLLRNLHAQGYGLRKISSLMKANRTTVRRRLEDLGLLNQHEGVLIALISEMAQQAEEFENIRMADCLRSGITQIEQGEITDPVFRRKLIKQLEKAKEKRNGAFADYLHDLIGAEFLPTDLQAKSTDRIQQARREAILADVEPKVDRLFPKEDI